MQPVRRLRWWIGGLLFASTVINYIDRQTLAALAPFLKQEYRWTNTDFATVLIAFRIAYTIGQSASGRLLDHLGTRRGLSFTVAWYSAAAALTSLAQGIGSFRACRFLLGIGESANWPGATKAVAEWFPPRERGWAVALFDSGSAVGGAVAPFLVLGIYRWFGSWRPAFLITAALGVLWLLAWRWFHRYAPAEETFAVEAPRVRWAKLLQKRQTWGIMLAKGLTDPYWFLVSEWFALYLLSRGFKLEESILGFWAPFLGADLGNFAGGALSSWWIARGVEVGTARRRVILIFGPSMLLLIPALFSSSYALLILVFAYATFAYAACATVILAAPADVFHLSAVASVAGLGGTTAGAITLVSTYLTGVVSDRSSFVPVMIAASLAPCLATLAFVTLVRRPAAPDADGLVQHF